MKNPIHIKLLKRIIKNTTPTILGNYFNHKKFLENKDFELLYKQSKKKELYYKNIQKLLEPLEEWQKKYILNDFQKVNFFINSNNDNVAYLLRFVADEDSFDLNSLNNCYSNADKVFVILLNCQEEFQNCYNVRSLIEYDARYWTHRNDYFDDTVSLGIFDLKQHFENLKQSIQKIFQQELRGNQCQGDVIEFENKIYVFFYLQDYPKSVAIFNEGVIEDKDLNLVFETIIIIDQERKVINIYSDSNEKRNELHQVIGSVLFKKDQVPLYCKNEDIFDPQLVLNNLIANKRFAVDLAYELSIKEIYVNKITLLNTFEGYSEITFNSKQTKRKKQYPDNQDMIYQLLSDQKDFQNPAKYKAKSLQFIVIVEDLSSSNPLIKRVTINKHGLTNLGFEVIDEQIKSCFRASGIMKS